MNSHHKVVAALLTFLAIVAATANAQSSWIVTVTPTLNPLPVGLCGAVHLKIYDPATRDTPRNPQGNRVTLADFDMSVVGASVAGNYIDAYHYEVCGCPGGTPGAAAKVTATYPAQALAANARVKGVSIATEAPFALAAPRGMVNPPACAAASAAAQAAPPVSAAPPPPQASTVFRSLPAGTTPVVRGSASPPAPPVGGALPPTAASATSPLQPLAQEGALTSPACTQAIAAVTEKFTALRAAEAADYAQQLASLSELRVDTGVRTNHLEYLASLKAQEQQELQAVYSACSKGTLGRVAVAAPPPPPAPVPVNPSGFTAVQTAPGQVQLWWQPVSGVSYYALFGPGVPQGGVKVTGVTTFTATAVPVGNQEWAIASIYEPGPVSTVASAFPRVTVNVTGPTTAPATSTNDPSVLCNIAAAQAAYAQAQGAINSYMDGGNNSASRAPDDCPPPASTTNNPTQTAPPAATPGLSGRYLVTVTGLRAYQASQDDPLSRDGRGDEVYAAAAVRRYDQRTGQVVESSIRKTTGYGDSGSFPQRIQAGSASGTGGIQDGDPIPAGPMIASRTQPAQDLRFPWRLWEGTLTDGADALIITPSIWEQDGGMTPTTNLEAWRGDGTGFYVQWTQQQQALDSSLFGSPSVQQQITQRTFGTVVTGAAGVNGNSGLGINLRNFTDLTLLSFGIPVANLLAVSADRAIGILPNVTGPNADQTMLPIQAVVLTREIIEAALAQPALGTIPSPVALRVGLFGTNAAATIGQVAPKPGILVLHFQDGLLPNILGVARPAIYQMFIQVERIP